MTRMSLEALIGRMTRRPAQELALEVPVRWAAVSAILRPRSDDDFDLLFIKRAQHEADPWSGHMAFPGGRVEPGEDALTAAIRESQEEIGLDLTQHARLIAQLDDVQAIGRGRPLSLVIRPYVFLIEGSPALELNEEVDEVVWIPLSSLLAGEGRGIYLYERGAERHELPCIRYQGYLIWGLTHHMLMEMLERIETAPESIGPDEGVL